MCGKESTAKSKDDRRGTTSARKTPVEWRQCGGKGDRILGKAGSVTPTKTASGSPQLCVTNEETFSELVSGLSKATEPLGAGIQSLLCPHLGGGRPAGVRRGHVGTSLRRGLNWVGSFQTTGWAEVLLLSYKWGCAWWRHGTLLGNVGTGFEDCHQAGTGIRASQGGT